MKNLYTSDPSILEMTPQHEKRLQSVLADLYYSDPKSCDFIEAIMNRVTVLEKRVAELERP